MSRTSSSFADITDPTDLGSLRAVIAAAPGAEKLVPLGIRVLDISEDASERLVQAVADELRASSDGVGGGEGRRRILLITDSTRILRGGQDLKAESRRKLEDRFEVQHLVLGHDAHLQADDEALDTAAEAARGADCVVTVGGGTITDIGKVATSRNGDIPLVVVQTAASVDGFTDNVSVVLRSGVKRTIPSRWPNVVLADTTVIADAPMEMNIAGFGEVLSLYTAPADWELAFLLGQDSSFHTTPRDLLLAFAGNPGEWARGLDKGETLAVERLSRVLAIRGIGTGIAGTTACLSGVEHLISHMLDMYAASHGFPVGLHGAQVGVGSLVAAAAWELLLERLDNGPVRLSFPEDVELEVRVRSVFERCDSTGEKGAECWADYSKKLTLWRDNADQTHTVLDEWATYKDSFRASVPSPQSLAQGLGAAGAAATPQQLDTWITPEIWKWAITNCHFMRSRLTVIDLLFFLGWWGDQEVDLVIEKAARAAEEAAKK